jgi:hypothetical protein
MALNTWVARFVVDHGRVTEEGNRLRRFQRRRLDEPDVDLHVLAEPSGTKGDDLGSQTLDAIGRLFLQDRLSLTGGLVRSLKETHQTLVDWNRRSVPRDQVGIGVTAALVSENVAYIAQAGPSLVYLRRGGVLRRLDPAPSAWTPLGEGNLEPSVRRIELKLGDLILAASASLENLVEPRTLEALLSRPIDDVLPELYLFSRDLPNFALFTISAIEGEDETEEQRRESQSDEPILVSPGYQANGRPTSAVETRTGTGAPASRAVSESNGNAPAAAPVLVAPRPVDISRTVVRLRNEPASARGEYARTTGGRQRLQLQFSDWRLVQIAAAVAVILIMVIFVPDLVRENRSERLGTLVLNSQARLVSAQNEVEPAQRRFLLEESRRLATEALRIDPTHASALEYRDQATLGLQAMDAVLDLGPMTTLANLSQQVTGRVSINSILVSAGYVFMLDTEGRRIIAVSVTGTGGIVTVFREGDTYGNTPAKAPLFMTWEGGDTNGRLLLIDADRKLFEMRPGSRPQPLALRRTSTWASVGGLETYGGNLYVLDPVGSQIHRYLPAAEGFDSEPTALLARETNLTQSLGFAVAGDIFVYYRDGKVGRFSGGSSASFNLGGIDRPIAAASDLEVFSPGEEVYIADSGNKRIVVTSKDGVFRRQLVSNAITDLSAITIDSTGVQLYVMAGDTLLTAPVVR